MDPDMTNPHEPQRNVAAGPGSTTARDIINRGAEVYDQARQAATETYDKTSQALNNAYDQAMSYGRQNPGKTTMIAFGVGLGLGLFIASGRRSRMSRYAEPMVSALTNVAMEFVRNL